MAAPLAQVCLRKINNVLKLRNIKGLAGVSQAADTSVNPKPQILVPKKIERDELAVLQALESTVEWDPTQPPYRYMDDPYFLPLDVRQAEGNETAFASGVSAAKFVMQKYPEPFSVRPLEDFSYTREAFRVSVSPTHPADTLEGLRERIDMELGQDAHNSYTQLREGGISVPSSLELDLLELLCFYNSRDARTPIHPMDNLHKQMDLTHRTKAPNNWRAGDLADQMFTSLENKEARAYSAMLRGRAKFGDFQNTMNFFKEMQESNIKLGLQDFNAVLTVIKAVVESTEATVDTATMILNDMQLSGVQPDLHTFNTFLEILVTSNIRNSRGIALDVLQEMKECGVEASAGTYHLVATACYHKKNYGPISSSLLWDILKEVENKPLEVKHPTDYFFFPSMMMRSESANDLKVTHAVNDLLHQGRNHRLLAHQQLTSKYFEIFFGRICTFEELDIIMENYNRYVPYTFVPGPALMESIIRAVSLHRGYQHIPQIWTDAVLMCNLVRKNHLLASFLYVMTEQSVSTELRSEFVELVESMWEKFISYTKIPRVSIVFGEMCLLALQADRHDLAWKYFDHAYDIRKNLQGFMREQPLKELAEVAFKEKNVPKLMKLATMLQEMVSPVLQEVRDRMKNEMLLSSEQIKFLERLD